jgi:hypothetical protein
VFGRASIHGDAEFTGASFEDVAGFVEVTFMGDALLYEASFEEPLDIGP